MFTKKILIDLDGVLNEYGKEKYNENYIPEIAQDYLRDSNAPKFVGTT